jgi:hypothetical protein
LSSLSPFESLRNDQERSRYLVEAPLNDKRLVLDLLIKDLLKGGCQHEYRCDTLIVDEGIDGLSIAMATASQELKRVVILTSEEI